MNVCEVCLIPSIKLAFSSKFLSTVCLQVYECSKNIYEGIYSLYCGYTFVLGRSFNPINSSNVGFFVKFLPLTPKIFVVRAFVSFEILSKVLNSSIMSWILSLFFLFASKLVFFLALTYANLGNGSGITFVSFPYFFLNILSMFTTFNSVLFGLFKSYCFSFKVDFEKIALPMNFSFKVFAA